ncbi:hypothetical protein BHF71_10335 [Vulcanibacillus modesticaldus]|uniref:ABC transmembrane type-1 domain-containing protein n=1 Tax=Vulcanibacillus modesticaldus TaxID=337097 RepID=A0A1D2YT14_9BACI|nr:ABC transporter transmembrane domain-containing protein [Vulcanibacillus modesticaldus]OEF98821.1 hypothetical protein BHF71_10335 [Vulcanibacillus modesticaldus]
MKNNSFKMHYNLKIRNWSTILLYSTLSAFFSLMPIKLIQYMIDSIKIDLSLVIISGISLILFYLLSSVTKGLNDFYIDKLALDVGHNLRVEMFNRILSLSYYEHKNRRFDEESSSLLEDVKIISENSIKPLSELLGSLISFILGLALVLTISPFITITLIAVGLLAAYVNKHFVDKYDKLIEKSRISSDGVWKLFNDINKYFEEIITNRRSENFVKLAKHESDKYRIEHLAETKHSRQMYAIDYVIFMSTIGILYLITSILVYYGHMTMGG